MNILLMPVPPMIEEAFDYPGSYRFVAFHFDRASGRLFWSDPGATQISAADEVWRTFTRHPRVSPFVEQFNFGNDVVSADRWLLLDRVKREFHTGSPSEVRSFLGSADQQTWSSECEVSTPLDDGSAYWIQRALTKMLEDWLDHS